MAEPYVEIKELKEGLKETKLKVNGLEKEVKALEDTKSYHNLEQNPLIKRIIASIKKLEQKVK